MSTTTQHTGERYAPIVANPIEWNINREYEYLTIVIYNGDSYISKQDVPKSVQITNTKYWLKTNNYRAQIDQAIEKSNEAISKATTATNLATSSLAKADEAKGKAEEASGKVNEAIGKADDAIGLATSGLAKADEAKGRSEEASGKANEAIAKADNALAKFPVSVAEGGTGATNAADARTNLGLDGDIVSSHLTQGLAYGPLASVTAKGHAEQDSTTGKNLLDVSTVQVGKAWNLNTISSRAIVNVPCEPNTTYTISNAGGTVDGLYAFEKASSADTTAIANYDLAKNSARTITTKESTRCIVIQFNKDAITAGDVESTKSQVEAGSTATPYEPYTGGIPSPNPDYPQEIRVVRGRNLLPNTATSATVNGVTFTVNADKSVTMNGTSTQQAIFTICAAEGIPIQVGSTYTLSGNHSGSSTTYGLSVDHLGISYTNKVTTTISSKGSAYIFVRAGVTVSNVTIYPQVEAGSTAHPYVPYGHVGLDITADGTTTTTPIPLPSRGWVGSLPDGTHDALAIDGAGKVTWELGVYGRVLDGTDMSGLAAVGTYAPSGGGFYELTLEGTTGATLESFTNLTARNSMSNRLAKANGQGLSVDNHGIVGYWQNNYWLRFRPVETDEAQTKEVLQTWLTSHPLSFYLPMQVKPTEDMGYIDLHDIPDGAVVSMPELEGLEVESWTNDVIADYMNAVAEKADTDTTYSLSQDSSDGHKLTFAGSDGTSKIVTIPDNDTKALGSMTGTLDISHGGTGKTTADEAWTALGGGSIGKKNYLVENDIPRIDASKISSGTFGVARGGTGSTSSTSATLTKDSGSFVKTVWESTITYWGKIAVICISCSVGAMTANILHPIFTLPSIATPKTNVEMWVHDTKTISISVKTDRKIYVRPYENITTTENTIVATIPIILA